MPVLGNQHPILYCKVTMFETVSLEAKISISVEDGAKHNGGVDLWIVQTTHAGNAAYQYN